MKRLISTKSANAIFVILLMVCCTACENTTVAGSTTSSDTTTTTTTTTTTSNGGVTCGSDQFCVNVNPPLNTTMILHQDGSYTQPCYVNSGSDTACILDADELDLYDQGFDITYTVPAGMCTYFQMQPYFYYQYQPGVGPSSVYIHIDLSGNITESDSEDGIPTATEAGGTETANELYVGTYMTQVGIQQPYTAEPLCSADYTNIGGPNCCYGNYTLTVDQEVSGAPDTVTTTSGNWGGNPNSCLVGPGMDSQTLYSGLSGELRNGYPEPTLVALDGQSVSGSYTVNPPISKGFETNAYIANFWQSGVTGEYPLTTFSGATGSPNAMQGPAPLIAGTGPLVSGCIAGQPFCTGNPWYEFDCLDGADDFVARIRVMVRSWTWNPNFQNFVTNQTVIDEGAGSGFANSLYNLFGAEPSPFGDQPIEDMQTWVTPYEIPGSYTPGDAGTFADPGTTGSNSSACYNAGTPSQDCGFGSMYPATGN